MCAPCSETLWKRFRTKRICSKLPSGELVFPRTRKLFVSLLNAAHGAALVLTMKSTSGRLTRLQVFRSHRRRNRNKISRENQNFSFKSPRYSPMSNSFDRLELRENSVQLSERLSTRPPLESYLLMPTEMPSTTNTTTTTH